MLEKNGGVVHSDLVQYVAQNPKEKAMPLGKPPSETEIARIYDEIADGFFYHKRDQNTDFDLVGWPWIRTILNGRIGEESVVLDVATGTGITPNKMLSEDLVPAHIDGVDISRGMIKIADREVKSDRASFFQMSALNLGFPDNRFDLAVSTYGMDYMPDVVRALSEVRRVLKPGASFVFLVPHWERHQIYYEGGGGSDNFPEGWYVETWPGSGGKFVPKQFLRMGSWSRAIDKAKFHLRRFYEPTPSNPVQDSAPDVFDRYKMGHRTIIFDLVSSE